MIYFIGDGHGHVKIGFSSCDSNLRLIQLQAGNPHKLTILASHDGDVIDERSIHRKFSRSRIRGEWFKLTDDIREYLSHRTPQRISGDLIAIDYAHNMDPKAIAKKHKVSLVTVYKWIKRAAQ
jgi:hypothetical protein